MTPTLRADANPAVLIWARETAGFSAEEAARSIGIKPDRLTAVESGEAQLTVRQLKSASNKYKRPLAIFYASRRPDISEDPVHDYRRPAGFMTGGRSPALQLEIRRALRRRSILIDLGDESVSMAGLPEVRLSEHSEVAATSILHWLGPETTAIPRPWRTPSEAFSGWKRILENHGILVFQATGPHSVEIDEMRGLSIAVFPLSIILLNGRDSYSGRIFTLFHELAHLALRNSGLCQPIYIDERSRSTDSDEITEVFCNHVAGSILVPRETLLSVDDVQSADQTTRWSDGRIQSLANMFRVSREALLRRLLILGKTNNHFYSQKRAQFIDEYLQIREDARQKARDQEDGVRIPQSTLAAARNGTLFSRTVLDALDNDQISYSDAAEYLGIKYKHIDRLNEIVRSQDLTA